MKKELLFCCACCIATLAFAQKKPLDHSVYDGWKQISNPAITPKGDVMAYEIQPQEGDGKLMFHFNDKTNRDIVVDRGYKAVFTPDGKYAVCLIKPFFQDTREAKIKKRKPDAMPKDSLAVLSLSDGKMTKFAAVLSYQIGKEAAEAVAFVSTDSTLIAPADRKKKKIGKPLMVYHFASEKCDTLQYVDQYAFDHNGNTLAVTTRGPKELSSVGLYSIPHFTTTKLDQGKPFYSLPQFDEKGTKVLYLASQDTASTGTKHCDLYLYEKGQAGPELLISKDYRKNLPEGWAVNEHGKPSFSENGERIFVGIAPIQAPKDTTLVSFETAELDLWHYNDPLLQPAQLKNLKRDLKKTCPAVYDRQKKELIPLTDSFYDQISFIGNGDASYVVSNDRTPIMVETQWDVQNETELSLVSLTNAARTPIAKGKFNRITASPDGNYVLWFDLLEGQWFIYDIKKATTACLTRNCGVNFWEEEDDRPQHFGAYGVAGWTKDDKEVLLYDRYDIWKLATDASSAINLTAGEGRQSNRTFRYIDTKTAMTSPFRRDEGFAIEEKKYIHPEETLLLSAFDRTTKKRGYATVKNAKAAKPTLAVLDGYTFGTLKKAKEANIYIYQKANFQTSPDLYVTSNLWKSEHKLSDINPQMKAYNWGTAELFKWNAFDGTPLEGVLYKPEGFDPNKKYPVMIYFYERKSDDLYAYYAPAPSRSTVNISFYCSRGYLVFVPDIVYTIGMPGENAYNCIVSGAEAVAKNPWADRANMAIQGQSWGGYQVAYLITRTNLFKAAGAGAPVSNMTSAYGGIRWESGVCRQFQYEHQQSRIGQNLWEAPELYITNSPLFKANRIETPLLMTHNDADGAVPWYQGIEFFTALRRLDKKVWMIQYNKEAHNLTERRNQKDLSIRLQQFFDHYLKGEPMPAWMKNGIPATRKGTYFGFETE